MDFDQPVFARQQSEHPFQGGYHPSENEEKGFWYQFKEFILDLFTEKVEDTSERPIGIAQLVNQRNFETPLQPQFAAQQRLAKIGQQVQPAQQPVFRVPPPGYRASYGMNASRTRI